MIRPTPCQEQQAAASTARVSDTSQVVTTGQLADLRTLIAGQVEHAGQERQFGIVHLQDIREAQGFLDEAVREKTLPQVNIENSPGFRRRCSNQPLYGGTRGLSPLRERAETDRVSGGDREAAGGFAAQGIPRHVLMNLVIRLAIGCPFNTYRG